MGRYPSLPLRVDAVACDPRKGGSRRLTDEGYEDANAMRRADVIVKSTVHPSSHPRCARPPSPAGGEGSGEVARSASSGPPGAVIWTAFAGMHGEKWGRYPFPPCGEGGSRRLTDEGERRHKGNEASRRLSVKSTVTPHPTSLRSATFSRKGRREWTCALSAGARWAFAGMRGKRWEQGLRPRADDHAGDVAFGEGGAGGLGGGFGHAGEARAAPAGDVDDRLLRVGELAAEAAVDLGQPVAGDGLIAEGRRPGRPSRRPERRAGLRGGGDWRRPPGSGWTRRRPRR